MITFLLVVAFLFLSIAVVFYFKSLLAFLIVGFFAIFFFAGLSFIPEEVPEPYDLDYEAIAKCFDESRYCEDEFRGKVSIPTLSDLVEVERETKREIMDSWGE